MSNIHMIDRSSPTLLAALEANLLEEMASIARILPEGEVLSAPGIQWFFTGHPGFNGILSTRIDDQSTIDETIAHVLSYFQKHHVSMGWPIFPLTRPTDLATHLQAHGLTYLRRVKGMAVDLGAVSSQISPPMFTVQKVTDHRQLQLWREITIRGFASTEEVGQVYYDTYAQLGFGAHVPWHLFIGWNADKPVAVSSLLLHAGVAGLYGIATVPGERSQGIGTAMTLSTLHYARSLGYDTAILSPSEMGVRVYQRLGFEDICSIDFYTWSRDQQDQ